MTSTSQNLPPFGDYHSYLLAQKLTCNTRIAYVYQVSHFLRWLKDSEIELPTEPIARDLAVARYKSFLKDKKAAKNASVNSALTAIRNFCCFVGLGEPVVNREQKELK
jgi:hypothetical protein